MNIIILKRNIFSNYIIIQDLLKFFFFFCFVFFNVMDYFNGYLIIKPYYEMIKLEEYFRICNENGLINKTFKKSILPKISIITPVFNKAKSLFRYLNSIQNQLFEDLEIILIDDQSTDDSLNVIEEFKKRDERIIFIKNKKRRGTLISRQIGVYKSNSDFLLFVDPDDMISENILMHSYSLAKKYNYELVRFNLYIGNYKLNLDDIVCEISNKSIFKPNLFLFLFYGFGRLLQLDYYITNKLIKRNLFIKALNLIDKFYLNQFMIDCEDGLVNFMLYRLSESLFFTRKIGYYYIISNQSITQDLSRFEKRLKSNFLYFKFIIEVTKNNNIEKNIANYIFYEIYIRRPDIIINLLKNLSKNSFNKDNELFIKTINLFLQNDFIPLKSKIILKRLKKAILYQI